MQSYSHFFSKNISVYGISNGQSFNMLTNDIVNFEQVGPDCIIPSWKASWLGHVELVSLPNHTFSGQT